MPFGFNFLHRLLGDVHTPHYFNEIVLVGLAADKPTGANAKDNMLYYETDTKAWKRYRAAITEWETVTGKGDKGDQGEPGVFISGVAFNLGLASVGTKQAQVLCPGNFVISKVVAYADNAPIGADLKINIKINTTSLWNDSDRLIIADGQNSGENADLDHYIGNAGDRLSLDVEQVGSTTPGGDDLLVTIHGNFETGEAKEGRLSGIVDASEYDTINLAITAANNDGCKFVWIPAGTYDIGAPFSAPADGFSIIGAGRKIVTLRATSSIDAVIKQVAKRYLTIGGFRIDGNGDQASKGIWIEGASWFNTFFDIEIRDIGTYALYLFNTSELGQAPYWNLFRNIQCGRVAQRGTHGIYMEGDINLNTFINVQAAADQEALYLKNFDYGGEVGVKAPQQNIFVAYDAGGSTDTTKGVRIDDHAYSNTFINPFIEGCNRSMDIQHKSNVVIGGLFNANTNDKILAPNGLDFYFYQIGATIYSHFLENPH